MPVWHAATRKWRSEGELVLVGITQEQHPERCELFAQWQGFDWPILWDPLNLTEAASVPIVRAIDEHGVVRLDRPVPGTFREDFLDAEFSAPPALPELRVPVRQDLLEGASSGSLLHEVHRACAQLLWGGEDQLDDAIEVLEEHLADPVKSPELLFRSGVAHRLRYDSSRGRPGDFQTAYDRWMAALRAVPNQYIWRRRVEQYGPRLDKPYNFYSWIVQAQQDLRRRGLEPVALPAPLTGSEIIGREGDLIYVDDKVEPDPLDEIEHAGEGWVSVESAVARAHSESGVARVHLSFRPGVEHDVHWNNESSEMKVWVRVPLGWKLPKPLLVHPNGAGDVSEETRHLDFEISAPPDARGPQRIRAYALFNACEGVEGTCVYRRFDFELPIELR